jgi:hypothetical protein
VSGMRAAGENAGFVALQAVVRTHAVMIDGSLMER